MLRIGSMAQKVIPPVMNPTPCSCSSRRDLRKAIITAGSTSPVKAAEQAVAVICSASMAIAVYSRSELSSGAIKSLSNRLN